MIDITKQIERLEEIKYYFNHREDSTLSFREWERRRKLKPTVDAFLAIYETVPQRGKELGAWFWFMKYAEEKYGSLYAMAAVYGYFGFGVSAMILSVKEMIPKWVKPE